MGFSDRVVETVHDVCIRRVAVQGIQGDGKYSGHGKLDFGPYHLHSRVAWVGGCSFAQYRKPICTYKALLSGDHTYSTFSLRRSSKWCSPGNFFY